MGRSAPCFKIAALACAGPAASVRLRGNCTFWKGKTMLGLMMSSPHRRKLLVLSATVLVLGIGLALTGTTLG
jgi:hypothetical protein